MYTVEFSAVWEIVQEQLTTTSNGCFDKRVQLLITSDGELQVAGCNTLHLQILGRISCQLKDLNARGKAIDVQ